MPKRFTQTEKWDDPWFRGIPTTLKCFWIYLCDRCDAAGVWEVDMTAAAFHLGEVIPLDKVWQTFGERIEKVCQASNGTHPERWRIVKFVQFQYPNLSRTCKPHAPVFVAIEKHGLDLQAVASGKVSQRYRKGKGNLTDTTKDKEKDTDKDKDSDARETKPDIAGTIYDLYPRKVARGDAIRAINKVLEVKPAEFLIEAVTAYAAAVESWPAEERHFAPHPSTWFNQGRYDDDRATWQRHVAPTAPSAWERR